MSALFGLGQSLLLALPPERAHDLAVKSLELGVYPRADAPDDQRLAQRIFGLDFPNPLGMAAGFDKNARVPRELLAMGFGFVEVGTLTPRAQGGNPQPRMFRSVVDRAVINRLGFNNEGQEAALARLKDRPRGIVGINLGAGRDSADRIGDYVTGIQRMAPVASYFTINISSPNTPGLRDLQAPEALDALLVRVQDARTALKGKVPPLLVKLAPDLADADLPEVVRVILSRGADGIVVSNTTLARDGLPRPGLRQGDRRIVGTSAVRPRDADARARLSDHARQAAADRRRRHRFRRGGARQDRGRGVANPALYRARVRRAGADRPHQANSCRGDGEEWIHDACAADRAPRGRMGGTGDMSITIYHNPRCSKSRETLKLIEARGLKPKVVEYLKTPPSAAELKAILKKLGLKADAIVRKGEPLYAELGLKDRKMDDDALIALLVANPILIERPIVVAGSKAAIGRPPEKVLEIL